MKKIFCKLHSWVEVIEPWGILLAALAILATAVQLWWDLDDRVQERTVSAWQLLNTPAPGNSGKIAALEYLNREDGFFCQGWIKYTKEKLFEGDHSDCLVVHKIREPLVGIDLSTMPDCDSESRPPRKRVYLRGVELNFANLNYADLNAVDLSEAKLAYAEITFSSLCLAILNDADLSGANLTFAYMTGADLRQANLTGADLRHVTLIYADLTDADLTDATLFGTKLTGANLSGANLTGANLSGADLSLMGSLKQEQLDSACGDEYTILPADHMNIKPCPDDYSLD